MSLIGLIITLVVVGVLLWLLNNGVPMDSTWLSSGANGVVNPDGTVHTTTAEVEAAEAAEHH